MAPPALLSRGLDPVLGIFTGVFAYYLYETHPRTALPSEDRLATLLRWKWLKFQRDRMERLNKIGDADWILQTPTASSK